MWNYINLAATYLLVETFTYLLNLSRKGTQVNIAYNLLSWRCNKDSEDPRDSWIFDPTFLKFPQNKNSSVIHTIFHLKEWYFERR